MLKKDKQIQILEIYNNGNRARYWNFTTSETEFDKGMLHQEKPSQILECFIGETYSRMLQQGKQSQILQYYNKGNKRMSQNCGNKKYYYVKNCIIM